MGRPHHRLGDTRVLVFLAALLRVRLHGHRVRRRQDPVLVGERPCWVRLNLCQGISWLVWLFIRQSSSLLSARFVFNFFLFLYLFHSSHFWVEISKEMLRSFSVYPFLYLPSTPFPYFSIPLLSTRTLVIRPEAVLDLPDERSPSSDTYSMVA